MRTDDLRYKKSTRGQHQKATNKTKDVDKMEDEKEHMSNEDSCQTMFKKQFLGSKTLKNIQKPDINLQVEF